MTVSKNPCLGCIHALSNQPCTPNPDYFTVRALIDAMRSQRKELFEKFIVPCPFFSPSSNQPKTLSLDQRTWKALAVEPIPPRWAVDKMQNELKKVDPSL